MAKDIHLSIQERLLMFYNIHFSIYIYIYIYIIIRNGRMQAWEENNFMAWEGEENLNSITLPHLWLVTSRASSPRSPYPHTSSKYFNFKVNALNNLWYDHKMVGEDAFRVRFKKKKERKKDAPRLHHLPRAHAFIYLMWILFMK
jgi:hypothetical protein